MNKTFSLAKRVLAGSMLILALSIGVHTVTHESAPAGKDQITQVSHSFQVSLTTDAHADAAAPAASPAPASGIAGVIQKIADSIPTEGAVITVLLFIYDFVRRKWPTKNPAGLIQDIRAVLGALKALIGKLESFLDRVFGQNLVQ